MIEIDEKFKLLRSGMSVIDVGAAPGGWSQVIAEKIKSEPGEEKCVAVDLLAMPPISGVRFV